MLEMVVLEYSISYTFMCRNKRIILNISAENLEGGGGLVDTFYQCKEDLDDPDIFIDFEGWAMDAVDERLRRLVKIPSLGSDSPTSLQGYYAAEIFVFTLVNRNGVLVGVETEYTPEYHGGPGQDHGRRLGRPHRYLPTANDHRKQKHPTNHDGRT